MIPTFIQPMFLSSCQSKSTAPGVKMFDLKGKVAVITGGANGIGAATVRRFLDEGAKFVAFIDIDETSGISLEKELLKKYGRDVLRFYKCDVTKDEQLFNVFNDTVNNHGYIDVVLNAAAICNDVEYKREIETNFTAAVTTTLKALEIMRKDKGGSGGTVIISSSVGGISLQTEPTIYVFVATKSALLLFGANLGAEAYYSHTGVRVITVCFGKTATKMLQGMRCIDDISTTALENVLEKYNSQPPEAAAGGIVEAYKNGKSGSVWSVVDSQTADITEMVTKGYQVMSGQLQV